MQKQAVLAAKRSIVTVEEIVDDFGPRSPNLVILPAWTVSAVVEVPGGAHPSYAHGYYKRDNAYYKKWDEISRDRDGFLAWMETNVLDQRAGGVRRRAQAPGRERGMNKPALAYTPTEMMTVAAARALKSSDVCFVGIGQPSAACNLARLTHAPGITLIYESGTLATKPSILPLSIGDGELCDTALITVSVPEMFRYWLQGGRITVGFLGGAQIDRFANLNTTVVGPYHKPKVRLPGGGGAPEIAISCGEIFIIMSQSQARLRRQARFRHLDRPRRGRRPSREARRHDQGADPADHRSLRVRPDPRDQGDDGRLDPSRRHPRRHRRQHRLEGRNTRRDVAETAAPDCARARGAARDSGPHPPRPRRSGVAACLSRRTTFHCHAPRKRGIQ